MTNLYINGWLVKAVGYEHRDVPRRRRAQSVADVFLPFTKETAPARCIMTVLAKVTPDTACSVMHFEGAGLTATAAFDACVHEVASRLPSREEVDRG